MILAVLKCAKGITKDEITTIFVSIFLNLVDTYMIRSSIEWSMTAYEPNNIEESEIVPRPKVNLVDSRIQTLVFQPRDKQVKIDCEDGLLFSQCRLRKGMREQSAHTGMISIVCNYLSLVPITCCVTV